MDAIFFNLLSKKKGRVEHHDNKATIGNGYLPWVSSRDCYTYSFSIHPMPATRVCPSNTNVEERARISVGEMIKVILRRGLLRLPQ